MADTTTTAYGLTKPEIGASEDTWGDKINANLDTLDSTINAIGGKTAAGTLKYADAAKLATTSTGVDVTGTVTADGLTVDNGGGTFTGLLPTIDLMEADTTNLNTRLQNQVGDFSIRTLSDNKATVTNRFAIDHATGDISFYEDTGTTAKFFWDASAEALGIGTSSPSAKLHVQNGTSGGSANVAADDLIVEASGSGGITISTPSTSAGTLAFGDENVSIQGRIAFSHASNSMQFYTSNTSESMRIDSSGNVGIGEDAPAWKLHIDNGADADLIQVIKSGGAGYIGFGVNGSDAVITAGTSAATEPRDLVFKTANTGGVESERMRISSSGVLSVANTTTAYGLRVSSTLTGMSYTPGDYLTVSASGVYGLAVNRLSSDGDIIKFSKDGTTVGSIGVTSSGANIYYSGGSGKAGVEYGNSTWVPWYNGARSDNFVDLGGATNRFDDVYATNGTIQTSDANEKQQIADLTAAEMQAAKAISKLFKTFKWNDSVAEKGDDARIHTGVIAQEVEAAMTAAGLDAGRYAFFISSTWWESTEVIPAVEAVEAVEAVYEDVIIPAVLDEEGTEIEPERTEQRLVSEAIEAVEAQPERTVTHTHETAEEAPIGAVERNRKGIRYPQLLAFVGAATEQRLASIEARLDAAGL